MNRIDSSLLRSTSRYRSDRSYRAGVHYLALSAAGFAAIGAGWYGAAEQIDFARQLPYLASGGIGGLGMVIIGVWLATINFERRVAARRRHALEESVAHLTDILSELRSSRARP